MSAWRLLLRALAAEGEPRSPGSMHFPPENFTYAENLGVVKRVTNLSRQVGVETKYVVSDIGHDYLEGRVVQIETRPGGRRWAATWLRALPRGLTLKESTMSMSFDLVAHLHRAKAFSEKTFGPGARTEGLLDHIGKELVEVAESNGRLEEWIDIAILAFDGAWRCGASPEAIAAALEAKQTKNERRQWPDWRTAAPGKAIEHVRTGEPA